ncbi:MAG: ATP-binding protein [Dehalococcoidia bacterium]
MSNTLEQLIAQALETPTVVLMRKLLHRMTRTGQRAETALVDFKQDFDGQTRAWCTLLAEGAALTNSGGGLLVYGVRDDGTRVGLERSLSRDLDAAKINDRLSRYVTGIQFNVSNFEMKYYKQLFLFLFFRSVPGLVVFDKDGNYTDGGQTKVAFNAGVIYVRRGTKKTAATQADINAIVRRLAENQAREFLARVERVASLPLGAEIIGTVPNGLGQGVLLTGPGQGIPVHVSEAEGSVPVSLVEVLDPDRPYSSLTAQVTQHLRQWKQEDPQYRIPKSTLALWLARRHEHEWTAEECELALLSGLKNRSFPNFWARNLPRARLLRVVRRLISDFPYPEREALPYLICAQLWSDRVDMFAEMEQGRDLSWGVPTKWTLKKLADMTEAQFFSSRGPTGDDRPRRLTPWHDAVEATRRQ